MSQIAIFEQMSALSAKMVEAARTKNWDDLVSLEASVVTLREALKAEPDASLPPEQTALKATLIQRILDDDAEVRRHTEPWMEHVRQFLGDGARKRQVEKAYGANQF